MYIVRNSKSSVAIEFCVQKFDFQNTRSFYRNEKTVCECFMKVPRDLDGFIYVFILLMFDILK